MAAARGRFRLTSPPRASEKDVTAGVTAPLQLRGYWLVRNQSGLFRTPDGRWIRSGQKGIPDYTALHERFPGFLLELKRPGATPTPEQIRKHSELRMGYRLAVGTVDSTESLARWLDDHERKATQLWRDHAFSDPASS
jgi:hypothetical protein